MFSDVSNVSADTLAVVKKGLCFVSVVYKQKLKDKIEDFISKAGATIFEDSTVCSYS